MTETEMNSGVDLKVEDEGDECPDFMEDGFMDNLAVVDSCYSDGEENADEPLTSSEPAPELSDNAVRQEELETADVRQDREEAAASAEPSSVAVANGASVTSESVPKHSFTPRPLRPKFGVNRILRPRAREFSGEDKEGSQLSEPTTDACKEGPSAVKTTPAKKAGDNVKLEKILQEKHIQLPLTAFLDEPINKPVPKKYVEVRRDSWSSGAKIVVEREKVSCSNDREDAVRRKEKILGRSRERVEILPSKESNRERDEAPKETRKDKQYHRTGEYYDRRREHRSREGESHSPTSHSMEREYESRRRPSSTDQLYPNRTWTKERGSLKHRSPPTDELPGKPRAAEKDVGKIREKPKIVDTEDNLLPPGTEDILLPDSFGAVAFKESGDRAKKPLPGKSSGKDAAKSERPPEKRRRASGDGADGRKKPRPDSDAMTRERVKRDQERMSRELSRERLKEADRELERQRAANEKLNEEIRRMREIRERNQYEDSLSRERSLERERRRPVPRESRSRERDGRSREREGRSREREGRSRERGRRYGELSPVSVERTSELSFDLSPGSYHSRYEPRYEYRGGRGERSFSPISSGGESTSERPRRRKRSPFWLEMERKLGISVVGGASYQYATAKEPIHYQPQPVAVAPPPVAYYQPPLYPVPPPTHLPQPLPLAQRPPAQRPPAQRPPAQRPPAQRPPAQRPPAQRPPAPRRQMAALAVSTNTFYNPALVEPYIHPPPALPAVPDFRFALPPPARGVPEAPPPPKISGDKMSLSSFLEASVKAVDVCAETERVARCTAALESLRDDDILGHLKSGRLVVREPPDLLRYTTKTRFDHPAQETLMRLKSPLLRSADVQLESTTAAAPAAAPSSAPDDDVAIIAEVPKNKVIDTLDLDPIGDSSDEGEVPPCPECVRRSTRTTAEVGVGTAVAATCDGFSQTSDEGFAEAEAFAAAAKQTRFGPEGADVGDVSDVSGDDEVVAVAPGIELQKDGVVEMSRQYERFRRTIGPIEPMLAAAAAAAAAAAGKPEEGRPPRKSWSRARSEGASGRKQKKARAAASQWRNETEGGPSRWRNEMEVAPNRVRNEIDSGPDRGRNEIDSAPNRGRNETDLGEPLFQRREVGPPPPTRGLGKPDVAGTARPFQPQFPSQSSFLEQPGTLGREMRWFKGDAGPLVGGVLQKGGRPSLMGSGPKMAGSLCPVGSQRSVGLSPKSLAGNMQNSGGNMQNLGGNMQKLGGNIQNLGGSMQNLGKFTQNSGGAGNMHGPAENAQRLAAVNFRATPAFGGGPQNSSASQQPLGGNSSFPRNLANEPQQPFNNQQPGFGRAQAPFGSGGASPWIQSPYGAANQLPFGQGFQGNQQQFGGNAFGGPMGGSGGPTGGNGGPMGSQIGGSLPFGGVSSSFQQGPMLGANSGQFGQMTSGFSSQQHPGFFPGGGGGFN